MPVMHDTFASFQSAINGVTRMPSKGTSLRAPGLKPQGTWNPLKVFDRFCAASGSGLPRVRRLPPWELPQPFQALLVHSDDMTPTLERHFGARAGLRVLRRQNDTRIYLREVLLTSPKYGALEYGIIQIHLRWFASRIREQILREKLPLGRLLQDHGIPHLCWPQGFYRFDPNPYLQASLGLPEPATLYGRRNVMLNGQRRLLADVLEILAPQAVEHLLSVTNVAGDVFPGVNNKQ